MKIAKTTITLTVLHPADESPFGKTLTEIDENMDSGPWIGSKKTISTVGVPDDKLHDELLAIGNDGTFFDND